MFSEDITFCMNDKCDEIRCFRNPKHIKLPIAHSFAWLEETEYCYKSRKAKEEFNEVVL